MASPAIAPRPEAFKGKYSAAQVRQMMATIRAHLAMGKEDLLICEMMKITPATYNTLKREMYEQSKVEIGSKSTEETYTDYKIKQEGCIKDLEDVIVEMRKNKNHNAMVGAIRAKSDIIDKLIKVGQEFGLVEKVPEKKQVIAGVLVAKLEPSELRALVAKSVAETGSLMRRFGNNDILKDLDTTGAKALPAASPGAAAAAAIDAEYVEEVGPAFSADLKPKMSMGGLAKAAGPKAAAAARRGPGRPPGSKNKPKVKAG